MLNRKAPDIKGSEVTDRELYLNRRQFMITGSLAAASFTAGVMAPPFFGAHKASASARFEGVEKSPLSTDEPLNSLKDIARYNNFYEFGTDKTSPAQNARDFKTRPWTVEVEGEVHKPRTFDIDELLAMPLEERIYRLRCVEAWSMVIPWVGFELRHVIERVQPTANAKYIQFVTLHDPERMPGQQYPILDWPYVEGLRMDEAMHPLTILAVGLYGEILPNQNGAPIRLVVPWKYGFKSIKSIVKLRFVEEEPATAWSTSAPHEYGFYANVNPTVDHPRWSQATERRIGHFFRQKTLMFNGYGDQVAGLYKGMDLAKYY